MSEPGIYLTVGTIVSVIVIVAGAVWKVSRIEKELDERMDKQVDDLRSEMDAQIDNVQRDHKGLERDSIGRSETLRHETGEMGAALRTKIHEVEMFVRDRFVSKESFELVVGRIEKSIERMGDKLEERIEKALERLQRPPPE
ncbi:hypothetical protein H8A97_13155 [Bradyrhizobium sp. Arg62]|uniref:hypothetical protein n=1 Tax=Bradyrhizobium brasilense TaxID=1419277 RepID=UPI001E397280|nr:hypothetical protein [Bradyrhizobium brasilense]MCC8946022.1 hypothetical protein [Bradyrhizobium brasilense]